MKKITEQEQINLRQQALDELNRLEIILQEVETRELLDKYKNRFNLCESAYKVVLHEHQIRTKARFRDRC